MTYPSLFRQQPASQALSVYMYTHTHTEGYYSQTCGTACLCLMKQFIFLSQSRRQPANGQHFNFTPLEDGIYVHFVTSIIHLLFVGRLAPAHAFI